MVTRARKAAAPVVVDSQAARAAAVKLLGSHVASAKKNRVIVPCPGCGYAAALDNVDPPKLCSCGCQAAYDTRMAPVVCTWCETVFLLLKQRAGGVPVWTRIAFSVAFSTGDSVELEAR